MCDAQVSTQNLEVRSPTAGKKKPIRCLDALEKDKSSELQAQDPGPQILSLDAVAGEVRTSVSGKWYVISWMRRRPCQRSDVKEHNIDSNINHGMAAYAEYVFKLL